MEEATKSATPKSGGKIADVEEEVECRHGFDDVALPVEEHGRLVLGDDDETKTTENSENIRLRQRKRCISVLLFVTVYFANFFFFAFNSSRNMLGSRQYPATSAIDSACVTRHTQTVSGRIKDNTVLFSVQPTGHDLALS